jgi:hypothetical protein
MVIDALHDFIGVSANIAYNGWRYRLGNQPLLLTMKYKIKLVA